MVNQKIKERNRRNQIKGKIGEKLSKTKFAIHHLGFSPERSPKGQDFTAKVMNWNTGKFQNVHIESKVNSSKLSKLQKKTRKKVMKEGGKYIVDRWMVK